MISFLAPSFASRRVGLISLLKRRKLEGSLLGGTGNKYFPLTILNFADENAIINEVVIFEIIVFRSIWILYIKNNYVLIQIFSSLFWFKLEKDLFILIWYNDIIWNYCFYNFFSSIRLFFESSTLNKDTERYLKLILKGTKYL